MKPVVRNCLLLGVVNSFLLWHCPPGFWWNFTAATVFACFVYAAYKYKPPKTIDEEMDVEQWIKVVYAYLYNKANA